MEIDKEYEHDYQRWRIPLSKGKYKGNILYMCEPTKKDEKEGIEEIINFFNGFTNSISYLFLKEDYIKLRDMRNRYMYIFEKLHNWDEIPIAFKRIKKKKVKNGML